MCSRKVILDFKNDTVRIGNQLIPTTKVLVPDTNDCKFTSIAPLKGNRSDFMADSMLHTWRRLNEEY